MDKKEAEIKIIRSQNKIIALSVLMPIWLKKSDHGHLQVMLPFLGVDTVAANEKDTEKAIEEALITFCVISERFGQGVEKELQSLGWGLVDNDTGEPMLGYSVSDADALIDRILQTGDNYINPHLEVSDVREILSTC